MSTLTFLMSHMVYFNNMKRNLGHIKVTQKPPQPMDYKYVIDIALLLLIHYHLLLGFASSCFLFVVFRIIAFGYCVLFLFEDSKTIIIIIVVIVTIITKLKLNLTYTLYGVVKNRCVIRSQHILPPHLSGITSSLYRL